MVVKKPGFGRAFLKRALQKPGLPFRALKVHRGKWGRVKLQVFALVTL